jgi:hypothetical protein
VPAEKGLLAFLANLLAKMHGWETDLPSNACDCISDYGSIGIGFDSYLPSVESTQTSKHPLSEDTAKTEFCKPLICRELNLAISALKQVSML